MTYNQFANMILLDFARGDPTIAGESRYDSGNFRMLDSVSVFNPRTVWAGPHLQVPNLAHAVDEWAGAVKACVTDTSSPFPLYRRWYYDQQATKLAVSKAFTRDPTTQVVTQAVTTIYDVDGVSVLGTCTDTIVYSGLAESSRQRTIQ